ncbi:MAG: DUF2946 family protein [Burkholderiales bacterium]|nr:DUF2946 family protein [Burkholderiales bacterium]
MDEIVLRGMAKWPNVPAVFGWLSLDRRGDWLIKGDRIAHPALSAYISRNYEHDDEGRWFFQNGPQRVFVALDYTPLVYRIVSADNEPLALACHTGKPVAMVRAAWLDDNGTLLLQTERGIGLVHDRDLCLLFPYLIDANGTPLPEDVLAGILDRLQQKRPAPLWLKFHDAHVRIEAILSAAVPGRFGFVVRPQQPAGQEQCC